MEKILNQKIIPAYQKSSNYISFHHRAFYKKHIKGEYTSGKATNHVGKFDEARYHKVLNKTIRKKPHKKNGKKLLLHKDQNSYIAKNVQVKEFGAYKAGLKEQTLSFEIAGKDGEGGGVVPEHLHRHFWGLKIHEGTIEGTELAVSQGGSEYVIEKQPRPYEGYSELYEGFYEQADAEEKKSDISWFVDGNSSWSSPWDPKEYQEEDMDTSFPELQKR